MALVLLGSPWAAKPRGQSGIEVTDLFPNIGGCVDDLCVIRSLRGDHNDHFQATLGVHTGSVAFKRPSVGSYICSFPLFGTMQAFSVRSRPPLLLR